MLTCTHAPSPPSLPLTPPPLPSWWSTPSATPEWLAACQAELPDLRAFAACVFHHGIPPPHRKRAWLILLGVVRYGQSQCDVDAKLKTLQETYEQLSHKLETFVTSTELGEELAHFQQQQDGIHFDVLRCDREFFSLAQDLDNDGKALDLEAAQASMRSILSVYALLHRYPGYFQGMSDLLEPLVSVLQDEAIAFHAFVAYMMYASPRFDTTAEDGTQVRGGCRSGLRH